MLNICTYNLLTERNKKSCITPVFCDHYWLHGSIDFSAVKLHYIDSTWGVRQGKDNNEILDTLYEVSTLLPCGTNWRIIIKVQHQTHPRFFCRINAVSFSNSCKSVALLKDPESFLATTSSTTQLQNCVTFDVPQFSKQKTSLTLHAVAADIMSSNTRATVNPASSKNWSENHKGMCTNNKIN